MPPNPTFNVEHPTLLVVDDNEMNRDMLGRRLEKKGYVVKTAADGATALELVAREAIDLILLDIEMPGLSGMDVLRALRKTYNGVELPIVMATARSESQDVVEALEAGANDYVTKPLDFPVVLARVETQLRNRRRAAGRVEPAAALDEDAAPGKILASKYRLEARIGAGAFGTVYRAKHVDLHQLVAVKVLHTSAARTPEAVARFKREGVAACRIKHPNAVSVLDFGTTRGGAAFLVMELLEGHGLDEELTSAVKIPAVRCAEIVRPVCAALSEAHRAGIVHRDIKPANVFLHQSVHGEVVKVLDFGIAKLLDDDARGGRNLTVEGGIIGTPAYMAPERFRGATPSGSADVYSVGVMLFQMLTGQLPYVAPETDLVAMAMLHINGQPPPLGDLVAGLPPAVERVVTWALAKQEAARPTAAQLAAGLYHALGLTLPAGAEARSGEAPVLPDLPATSPVAHPATPDPTMADDRPLRGSRTAPTRTIPPTSQPGRDEDGRARGEDRRRRG